MKKNNEPELDRRAPPMKKKANKEPELDRTRRDDGRPAG